VLGSVPKGLEAKYIEVMRPYFRLAEEASANGDDTGLLAALININSVPMKLLAVPRGGKAARNRRRNLNIVQRNIDEHLQLLEQNQAPTANAHVTPKSTKDPGTYNLTEAEKLLSPSVRRVVAQERSRHTSRAVRAIYNSNLVDIASSQSAQEDMVRLHPECPYPLPALPPDSPYFAVAADDNFAKIWRKHIANGAAAGPTKFSGDHGLPLLDDPDCLRGLAVIIQRICNGTLPDAFKPVLLACNLIGTPKRDGSTRPVAIGEALYKMAAFLLMASMKGEMIECLGGSQFAFLPGGSETAALLLKALLEDGTGLACDLKNAFNSLRRDKM
jgi:hypothetical protein